MIRRLGIWIGVAAAILVGLLAIVAVLVFFGANTGPGRQALAWLLPRVTSGEIHASGISGDFPFTIRARRLSVSDTSGPWLTVKNLDLTWEPAQLFHGRIVVDRLIAAEALVRRLPQQGSKKPPRPPSSHARPMPLLVRQIAIGHLTIGSRIAATEPSFSVHGSVRRENGQQEALSLEAKAADGGRYTLEGKRNDNRLAFALAIAEPSHGPLAALAKLPDLGSLHVDARLAGPIGAVVANVHAMAGPLVLNGSGTLDLTDKKADLSLSASAPAMRPRPDLAWQGLALSASVRGTWSSPLVTGHLTVADLAAAGAKIATIEANANGSSGSVELTARFSGITLPGSAPTLLSGAPLVLDARMNLEAKGRPVDFTLHHPLIAARGTLKTSKPLSGEATISIPSLAPFAKLAGTALDGKASIKVAAAEQKAGLVIDTQGDIVVSGGAAPFAALLGGDTKIAIAATTHGSEVALAKLSLRSANAFLRVHGRLSAKAIALTFAGDLKDLSLINKNVTGSLSTHGSIEGATTNLALDTDLDGTLGMRGSPPGALHAKLTASGLPRAPEAKVRGNWAIAGAPLDLALDAARSRNGALTLDIHRATWKSASAEGTLELGKDAAGSGRVAFRVGRLADLSSILGTPLKGSLAGHLAAEPDPERLVLTMQGHDLGNGAASIAETHLTATLNRPLHARRLDAKLTLAGIRAAGVNDGSVTITAAGPENALALALNAATPAFGSARLSASAVANVAGGSATVASLAATFHGATAKLLGPTRITFKPGIAIDRVRIGMDGAELALNGKITPKLALAIALRNVTPALLAHFKPGLKAKGRLDAEAHLAGTLAHPEGTFRVHGSGLGLTSPAMAGLPPASIELAAKLANHALKLNGSVSAGSGTRFTISGNAPLAASGKLDLAARGALDLASLDPVLAANGRRIAGRLTLAATITGAITAPRISGSARLADGTVEDYANGVSITNIAGDLEASGDTLRIVHLEGQAGPGSIAIAGSIGILAPGIPITLRITAHNAKLLSSDRMSVRLDSDLAINGSVGQRLSASGQIHILRAEIEIPKRMPASIPVLNVVRPGGPPPRRTAPAKAPVVALDIFVVAPREIFVRGRGVDAEFGGRLHVTGTSTKPVIQGGLRLIRGQVSLAGQTLTFTQGTIGFNGGDVTDPTLDLVATTSTSTTTATLTLGGTAQHPKVTLSSSPELPQDQVLAALLFGQSASSLSPFQLAEIANALASLSGSGPSIGNPLGTIRKGLGLDVLSVGSSANGNPTLKAGRYVAPGVYVGASQTASGAGTSANVVVNLSKHLKLNARVGSRASGPVAGTPEDQSTSVGLSYQFQY